MVDGTVLRWIDSYLINHKQKIKLEDKFSEAFQFTFGMTEVLLANAMVSSRLDYCNSLLYGVSRGSVAKLQKVQNVLCHFVYKLDKMSHVKLFREKLHWLPISYILFKYNILIFKAKTSPNPLICYQ